jgi:hypothetical protein
MSIAFITVEWASEATFEHLGSADGDFRSRFSFSHWDGSRKGKEREEKSDL